MYKVDGEDFEDSAENVDDEIAAQTSGVDLSAVGLKLRLTKNDGVFKMVLKGEGSGEAEWRLDGLEDGGGRCAMASAITQTSTEISRCRKCFDAQQIPLSTSAIQNLSVIPVEPRAPKPTTLVSSKISSTATAPTEVKSDEPQKIRDNIVSSAAEHQEQLKRKTEAFDNVQLPLSKRAKSCLLYTSDAADE